MPSFSSGASPQKQQHNARRKQLIRQQRKSLPIASVKKRLVEEVKKNDTLIVVGETGSGKTTQLPQFLYDAGFCQDGKVIGITQPRRVAAVTVAKRVAEECNDQLGKKVGYSIRFDDSTSNATRIKYMTDGLLLREALLDPLLSKYSVIVVDEAHERTVHTDVLLGLLKKVQRSRSICADKNGKTSSDRQDHSQSSTLKACQGIKYAPLKLIIMSASLDAKCFSDYFGGAKAVHIQGRQYPVDTLYTYQPESDYLDATLVTIFQIHLEEGPGDILAFLTGQEEIESLERLIQERARQLPPDSTKIWTTPIYSSLPSEQQMNAFKPAQAGARKARAARKSFESSEGDHITLVNVYRAALECLEKSKSANAKEKTMEKALNRWCWENFINYRSLRHARDVHSQIQGHVQQMGLYVSSCGDDMVQFRRCLTAAFFLNAAMRQPDGSFRALATGQSVQMHPSSVLFRTKPDCVIFNELVRTTQNYVKNLSRIDPLWLAELAPQYYATED
ncbi:hypothetical protein BRADI_4g16730v3 [Brachypodium distachyon]|uniref:RNA helicase n=1 Tax=Brachypodium distachyon TaxID=15368 RepID=A0A2K2CN98_BRADI|nr:hypothetical protein BRADI_4g16730v3 [Brachypodium distachyon]